MDTYGLGNVVNDDGAVGVAVIHGRKGLVAFLAGGIPGMTNPSAAIIGTLENGCHPPNLKLYCG